MRWKGIDPMQWKGIDPIRWKGMASIGCGGEASIGCGVEACSVIHIKLIGAGYDVLVMSGATAGAPCAVYHCLRPSNIDIVVLRQSLACQAFLRKKQSACRCDDVPTENTICMP
jgi:hypothetical protein